MRIISGKFRGKKIFPPKDLKTRPLKDLTKESIFNIICHSNKLEVNLKNSNILDLFSGIGSFGIECLSRGVSKVTFVENYDPALEVLKKNLHNLKSIKNYEIFQENIDNGVDFLNQKNKFDIIFLDPPYKNDNIEKILFNIYEKDILSPKGIVILHRHKKREDNLPKLYKIIEKKIYGISKIIFLS